VTSSVAQVVGSNARTIRHDAGLTLDHIAQAARFVGLPWTSGRVGDLESGRVGPDLRTLYALTLALTQVTGQPVSLADLLAGGGPVQINDGLSIELAALRAAVSGQPPAEEVEPVAPFGPALVTPMPLEGFLHRRFREADVRMCKSIGIDNHLGALLMAKLWGRTFSDERDHRAEPDANAQRKGQISRQLKAELEKAIH
jgi:transcriptional regulator with XRE-family HTH domain